MSAIDPSADPQGDPQTHLDTDPVNQDDIPSAAADHEDDPAHDAGRDEGWESAGEAAPSGPGTDT